MDNKILFALNDPKAQVPKRFGLSAGYDFYGLFEEDVWLAPKQILLVKTGVHYVMPKNYVGVLKERSSLGIKGLAVRAGVLDCDYRGEIKIALNNCSEEMMFFTKEPAKYAHLKDRIIIDTNKAIAQMLVIKFDDLTSESIDFTEFQQYANTERGENGFGHTNNIQK